MSKLSNSHVVYESHDGTSQEVDEIFFKEALAELRDGEAVTLEVRNVAAARRALARVGATEQEVTQITIKRMGSQ